VRHLDLDQPAPPDLIDGWADSWRPRLLDLFCGAGGCSVGYHRAGFDVTGVDIVPQHRYPFLDLAQDDAMLVLADVDYCRTFDAIHASPPCQLYSATHSRWSDRDHPDLIGPVRAALIEIGRPYVIENVVGAPLIAPVLLCGSMFDLTLDGAVLKRHRLFESSVPLIAPADRCAGRPVVGVYGTGGAWTRTAPGGGGVKVSGAVAARLMGIDWTDHQAALAQAIPPAYTEHIGRQLFAALERV
jgi:DNA (cytosine-5)-methyltransferase 1